MSRGHELYSANRRSSTARQLFAATRETTELLIDLDSSSVTVPYPREGEKSICFGTRERHEVFRREARTIPARWPQLVYSRPKESKMLWGGLIGVAYLLNSKDAWPVSPAFDTRRCSKRVRVFRSVCLLFVVWFSVVTFHFADLNEIAVIDQQDLDGVYVKNA